LVSVDYFNTSGTIASTTSDFGPPNLPTIQYIVDNSPDTEWQSAVAPTDDDPVYIMVTLVAPQVPSSYRIRAADDLTINGRGFPSSVSVWGSNVSNPSITNSDQWIPIRGNVYLDEPGVEGNSR
jgi:hypothetical protein